MLAKMLANMLTDEKVIDKTLTKAVKKGPNVAVLFATASGEMADVLSQSAAATMPKVGDLLSGKVLSISKNGVIVDIDGRLTGLVRGRELDDESGQFSKLAIGEQVEASVLEMENEQGMLELSFRQAGHRKAWDYLEKLLSSGEVVDAKIIDANKGGLMVKVGNVEGFLPVSQLTTEHYPRVEGGDKNRILDRLRSFAGQTFKVRVITVKEQEEKLIVSEKLAWEHEQNELLSQYKIGSEITGTITGVVDFGAFVEFGRGLEGLVHISELAWQRITDPHDVIKVGDEIKAKIIAIDDGRISLSIKQLSDDPWRNVGEQYKVGQKVSGRVLKLSPYGAFVELDQQIHGLAHVSELTGDKNVLHPSEIIKVGDVREFKILSLEPGAHRLGLALADGSGEAMPIGGQASEIEEKKEHAEPT